MYNDPPVCRWSYQHLLVRALLDSGIEYPYKWQSARQAYVLTHQATSFFTI